jgi:hypothetical protein
VNERIGLPANFSERLLEEKGRFTSPVITLLKFTVLVDSYYLELNRPLMCTALFYCVGGGGGRLTDGERDS